MRTKKKAATESRPKQVFAWIMSGRYWYPEGNEISSEAKRIGLEPDPQEAALESLRVGSELEKRECAVFYLELPEIRALSDATYVADSFMCLDNGVLLSNMVAPHRGLEPFHIGEAFAKIGVPIVGQMRSRIELSSSVRFIGDNVAIVSHGVRGDIDACAELKDYLPGVHIIPVKLTPRFIHADTCFGYLPGSPPECETKRVKALIFSRAGLAPADDNGWNPNEALEEIAECCQRGKTQMVEISVADGLRYGTNFRATACGRVFGPSGLSESYSHTLKRLGYSFHPIPMRNHFEQGGGAVGCKTNDMTRLLRSMGWLPPAHCELKNLYEKLERRAKKLPHHVV